MWWERRAKSSCPLHAFHHGLLKFSHLLYHIGSFWEMPQGNLGLECPAALLSLMQLTEIAPHSFDAIPDGNIKLWPEQHNTTVDLQ